MRELRFRAWSKSEKKMIYNIQNEFEERIELGMDCFSDYLKNDDFIVEQYTGLKDKNDKEIYEGDLVSCGTIDGNPVGLVGFSTDFGCWDVLDPNHAFGGENFNWHYCREMEVVGNIHENHELLDKDQSNEKE